MTQVVHVPLGDRAYDIHIGRDLMGQAGALIEPVLQSGESGNCHRQ